VQETWKNGVYRGTPYGNCLHITLSRERFSVVAKIFLIFKLQLIDIPPDAIVAVATRRNGWLFFLKALEVKLCEYPSAPVSTLFFVSRRRQEWLDAFAACGVKLKG
jgi:hypothetical protein